MARTVITPQSATGSYPTSGNAVTMTSGDATNGDKIAMSNRDLLVIHNTDTASHTYSVSSVAASELGNRSGDLSSISIGADAIHVLGPFQNTGWEQSDGSLYLDCDDSTVEFALISL